MRDRPNLPAHAGRPRCANRPLRAAASAAAPGVSALGIAACSAATHAAPSDGPGALGRRVAALREAAGLSQAELARRTGVSQSAISLVEAGSDPRAGTVRRIAGALGVPVAALFGEAPGTDAAVGAEEAVLLVELRREPAEVRAQVLAYLRFVRAQRPGAAA